MIGLLQRVSQATVQVDGRCVGRIDQGLLVLVGVQKHDSQTHGDRLIERLLGYRVFPDADGKMNCSVRDVQGGLLLVPQFTLPADTRKGTRPSFSTCAPPEQASRLFDYVVQQARALWGFVETGEFGADMQVSLVNDGPVTFWLEVNA